MTGTNDERALVEGLRARDPEAFATLLDEYHAVLVRIARRFVSTDAVADEVVSDTWVAVMRGIDGFEGRSSLKTWMVGILSNIASRRGAREARSVPFSSLADDDVDRHGGFGDDAFERSGPLRGHWAIEGAVGSWHTRVESGWQHRELLDVVGRATAHLPMAQRQVFVLRDIEDWSSAEVSDVVGVSAGNQRVLLHRARARVRLEVARYLDDAS